jgi:alkylation response protein AidB-like acyl-CoA dehydrogenase
MDKGNSGFVLSEELTALRDQVRRIIRDEIIPIEERIDPDAAEIPESEFWPIARKTQAAGLWCMGVPQKYGGGGLGTFDMCVLMEEMAASDGTVQPGRWRIRAFTAAGHLGWHRGTDPEVCRSRGQERLAHVLCDN